MSIKKFVEIIILFSGFSLVSTVANANEILGQWKTKEGDIAIVSECETSFCINMETGKFSGKLLAKFITNEDIYKGIVYNPAGDNEFTANAFIKDDILEIKACPVAFLCKTQKWTRI
ncbi:MAG: DUF2147 domain-containing protein [Devosiaceae bacterium]|nr:DUF2147 domain-containing protein [Devosiaceae bacterium]